MVLGLLLQVTGPAHGVPGDVRRLVVASAPARRVGIHVPVAADAGGPRALIVAPGAAHDVLLRRRAVHVAGDEARRMRIAPARRRRTLRDALLLVARVAERAAVAAPAARRVGHHDDGVARHVVAAVDEPALDALGVDDRGPAGAAGLMQKRSIALPPQSCCLGAMKRISQAWKKSSFRTFHAASILQGTYRCSGVAANLSR